MTGLLTHLSDFGGRRAVATREETLTYRDLAGRVQDVAERLGPSRRLVLIETRNELTTLVPYLGALAGGHVVLPVPPGRGAAMADVYHPDVQIDAAGTIHEHRAGSAHRLHPDLALLLSTSGSTGSPKLVRLSRRNLVSNAAAIAQYLDIRDTDRAATTLPMSYCYGLSVLHSHLLRGAGVILSDHSVVDDGFWELFSTHGGTSFAGVPYTFDLLDRIGFEGMDLPRLRYVTQAGGRLPPERVRRFAELGERAGWRFVVMYGATEATARMAYLPPDLARTHPHAIGRPIPGGAFSLEPLGDDAEPELGELVYRGPNVMMGYAHSTADLEAGRTVEALRTGDIARRTADGLYEVVGRRGRFVKLYGLRIDLQRVEERMAEQGVPTLCTHDDDRLIVAVAGDREHGGARRIAAEAAGLPAGAVSVAVMAELPRLPSGKPDYPAVREAVSQSGMLHDNTFDVRGLFAEVLQVDPDTVTDDSTFVGLGGNSLSYVAASVRLERALGGLPAGWQQLTVGRLQAMAAEDDRPGPWFAAALETSVALRAMAIVLIVGSHAGLFELWGGAHILLGVAGYNFGRFCLTPVPRDRRVRHLRTTIAWIAVPSIAWVSIVLILTDDYTWSNLLLANKILGPFDSMTAGRLWFVEVLVWTLIVLTVICGTRLGDRLERAYPFAFAAVFLAIGLALRYDIPDFGIGRQAWFTFLAFWFFAAGWAAAKASATWQRVAVTVVLLIGIHGYFGDAQRELLVSAGLVLLIWQPAIRCPAKLAAAAGVVAEASLYTYLTHYQVYALLHGHPLLGLVASIAVGILITRLVNIGRTRFRVGPLPGAPTGRRSLRSSGSGRRGS